MLQFTSGAFAPAKDLEFMYVLNLGRHHDRVVVRRRRASRCRRPTESGGRSDPREFEAKYEFYVTKAPAAFAEIAKGSGVESGGDGGVRRADCAFGGRPFRSPRRSSTIRHHTPPASRPSWRVRPPDEAHH